MQDRGLLIAIEGVDAVGKRTQSSILISWIRSRGASVSSMSFPDYETELGKEIKRFLIGNKTYPPEVRHMLFAANRWEKKDELETQLSASDFVVVNRYSPSNLAYGASHSLPIQWLRNLEEGLPVADVVAVLDASPASLSRRRGINKDRYETNMILQERTRDAYTRLAEEFGWKVVDASKGIEATSTALISAISDAVKALGRTV